MKIIIVSILALALIFMAFRFKKSAKQKNDLGLRFVSLLFLLKGINILIVGNAYLITNSKGWTTENAYYMILIATISIGVSLIIIGLKFLMHAKKTQVQSGVAGAAIWILIVLAGMLSAFKIGSSINSGWTQERKEAIINKCPDLKYKKLCYLDQVMKKFPNPNDYNDITDKQLVELNKAMEENCLLCDIEREKEQTVEVEGLPDDF